MDAKYNQVVGYQNFQYIRSNKWSVLGVSLALLWFLDVYTSADTKPKPMPKESVSEHQERAVLDVSLAEVSQTLPALTNISLPPAPQVKQTPRRSKVVKQNTNAAISEIAKIKVMQSLSALTTQQIQFLLPESDMAKNAFLSHMYRCEKMQFGTVTKNKPYQLSVLSRNNVTVNNKTGNNQAGNGIQGSQLLRVAHDYLSKYERNLMTLYGNGGRPVRIFPASLDVTLSARIAQALNGVELSSFSARYSLVGTQVELRDIYINQSKLHGRWLISSPTCS